MRRSARIIMNYGERASEKERETVGCVIVIGIVIGELC